MNNKSQYFRRIAYLMMNGWDFKKDLHEPCGWLWHPKEGHGRCHWIEGKTDQTLPLIPPALEKIAIELILNDTRKK